MTTSLTSNSSEPERIGSSSGSPVIHRAIVFKRLQAWRIRTRARRRGFATVVIVATIRRASAVAMTGGNLPKSARECADRKVGEIADHEVDHDRCDQCG